MKDQIVMSPNNGACAVAIPLVRFQSGIDEMISTDKTYTVALVDTKPIAFILDIGTDCQVVSAEWAYNYLEFLGEL